MEKGDDVWAVVKNYNGWDIPWQLKRVKITLVLSSSSFQIQWALHTKTKSAVYPGSRLYTKKPSDDEIAKNSNEPKEVQRQFSEAVLERKKSNSKAFKF